MTFLTLEVRQTTLLPIEGTAYTTALHMKTIKISTIRINATRFTLNPALMAQHADSVFESK